MTIDIGDAVRVVMTWAGALGEAAQNVWHMEMQSGAGIDPADLIVSIRTQVRVAFAEYEADISSQWSIVQYDLLQRDKTLHQWDGVAVLGETTLVGTDAGDFLPHGVAVILRYSTAKTRRQGRQFIPGHVEGSVTAGLVTSAVQARLLAFASDWGADIAPTGGLMQLCTYNVEPTSIHFETPSLADGNYIANSIPGYQRRRKPGVGI